MQEPYFVSNIIIHSFGPLQIIKLWHKKLNFYKLICQKFEIANIMHSCVCTAVHCQSLLFAVINVCMSVIIILAPEIVIPPSSVTVFSGNTAKFTCQAVNADFVIWRLNGTKFRLYNTSLPPIIDITQIPTSVADIHVLTITARTEYHGLVFQCVAGMSGGGPEVESENATLMVQGTVELWLV